MTTPSSEVQLVEPEVARTRSRALPDRPTISTPAPAGDPPADNGRGSFAQQPGLGLAGLLLVVPVAALIAVDAGGPSPRRWCSGRWSRSRSRRRR